MRHAFGDHACHGDPDLRLLRHLPVFEQSRDGLLPIALGLRCEMSGGHLLLEEAASPARPRGFDPGDDRTGLSLLALKSEGSRPPAEALCRSRRFALNNIFAHPFQTALFPAVDGPCHLPGHPSAR